MYYLIYWKVNDIAVLVIVFFRKRAGVMDSNHLYGMRFVVTCWLGGIFGLLWTVSDKLSTIIDLLKDM